MLRAFGIPLTSLLLTACATSTGAGFMPRTAVATQCTATCGQEKASCKATAQACERTAASCLANCQELEVLNRGR